MAAAGRRPASPRDQNHLAWDPAIAPVAIDRIGRRRRVRLPRRLERAVHRGLDHRFARDARLRQRRPGHRAGRGRGRRAGRHAPDRPTRVRARGLGLDRLDPRLRPAGRRLPRRLLKITRLDPTTDRVEFWPGIRLPLAPFCGELGVAPETGPLSTIPPDLHGGNMDTRHLVAGSTLFLPVFHAGARFSDRRRARDPGRWRGLGDGHRDADAGARPPHRAQGPAPHRA